MWIMTTDHAINMDHVAHITRHRDDTITVVFAVTTSLEESGAPYPHSLDLKGDDADLVIYSCRAGALGHAWPHTAARPEAAP